MDSPDPLLVRSGMNAPVDPLLRLRSIPWEGLSGLSAALAPSLAAILAGSPAERALDRLLRDHRGLTAKARAAVAEALFGVGLWRRRLAYHLGARAEDLPDPRALLFALLRDLAGLAAPSAARLAGLEDAPSPQRPPPAALADLYSLPDWLAELLERELCDEAAALAAALCVPGPICLRVNTLKTTREALSLALAEEGVATRPASHAPHGLIVTSPRPNLYGLAALARGELEVQDEGSQLLAALLEASPGQSVFDYCAGAGGKTLALAAAMQDQGVLHAYDPDLERLERLARRAARAGVTCHLVHRAPPPGLTVDAVLVDAPCSELGALRRGPDLRFRIDPAVLPRLPLQQRQILEAACRYVRPGGRLIYATCTLASEENQELALSFERSNPAFIRIRPGEGWLSETFVHDNFFVALPHRQGTDGFFAAVYQRRSI